MKQFLFGLVFISISGLTAFAQTKDLTTTFERGVALANQGNFADALAEFHNAEGTAEDSKLSSKRMAQLNFNIGVCLFRTERHTEAISRFESAVQIFPKYERAHYALGMAASAVLDWQKAERAFLAALKVNKANGESWFDLAFVYLATGEKTRAVAGFERSLEMNTFDAAAAHNNLGVLKASMGDRNGARRSFENAVRVSSGTYEIAAVNLAIILAGDTEPLVAENFTHGKQRNFLGENN